jgi:hypothetical protein
MFANAPDVDHILVGKLHSGATGTPRLSKEEGTVSSWGKQL